MQDWYVEGWGIQIFQNLSQNWLKLKKIQQKCDQNLAYDELIVI